MSDCPFRHPLHWSFPRIEGGRKKKARRLRILLHWRPQPRPTVLHWGVFDLCPAPPTRVEAGGGMLLEESVLPRTKPLRQLALAISIIEPPGPWLKKESGFVTYVSIV